jgi:beta-lactamase class A
VTDHRETITRLSQEVGTFHVACRRLDAPGEFTLGELDVVPIASMYKVLLALEVADAFERGDLRPDAGLRVEPGAHSPGGFGLTEFAYPATVSVRDLLYMSLAWSDNTASDVLLDLVGLDAVHARADGLGLETVRIVGDCRTLLRHAGEDFGYPSDAAAEEGDWEPRSDDTDLVLGRTNRASVADLVRLAMLIEQEQAAAPAACRLVRDLMERQVWTIRFAHAFPPDSWLRASKTGTLSPWRGEMGVLVRNDGARLALAVVVRQHRSRMSNDLVDRALSAVAAASVELAMNSPG